MNKSYNDIQAQLERVIATATERGKYQVRKTGKTDIQRLAQIAARTRSQHGISMFTKDRDERKPLLYPPKPIAQPAPIVQVQIVQPYTPPAPPKPKKDTSHLVNAQDWFNSSAQNRKQIQDMCRHEFITKMFAELLADFEVCKWEGWDIYEYPRLIRKEIDRCLPKPKQLSLF